jgi:hypothetical protein
VLGLPVDGKRADIEALPGPALPTRVRRHLATGL